MFSFWRTLKLPGVSRGTAADLFFLPRPTSSLCSDRRRLSRPSSRKCSGKRYNVPPSAEFVARVSGIPTMAKLPFQETADGLDAAFIGVPIDTGTSNRPGARFGPRQIRVESAMLRSYNSGTRAAPYESLMVADIGDVNVNVYDLKDTCKRIREAYRKILATGCIPLTMGGDHTIAYPILQAVAEKHGPVGLIHVDAHADTSDVVLGEKIGHGTPFRRCVEEGLLDCKRVVQIGLRGSGYSADSYEWSRAQVRDQMGGGAVYLSFDIDALDPGFAPGTGTPEIAGLTPIQGLEIIRGCRGLNLVGCDLVEEAREESLKHTTVVTEMLRPLRVWDAEEQSGFFTEKESLRKVQSTHLSGGQEDRAEFRLKDEFWSGVLGLGCAPQERWEDQAVIVRDSEGLTFQFVFMQAGTPANVSLTFGHRRSPDTSEFSSRKKSRHLKPGLAKTELLFPSESQHLGCQLSSVGTGAGPTAPSSRQ
ncbi:hypothetical protein FQN60_002238, partial [Etheostoma spectabile]